MVATPDYAKRAIDEKIETFMVPLRRKGLKARTIQNYAESLFRDLWVLYSAGLEFCPSKIDAAEMEYLIKEHWTGAPKYNLNRRTIFTSYLQYHCNKIIKEYPIPHNLSQRTTIGPDDWLSDEEAVAMYLACEDPMEKWVVHGMLKLALRKYDLMNVTRDDVFLGFINVLGKGDRREPVAFVGDTRQVLADLYAYLDELCAGFTDVPRDLLIYKRGVYKTSLGVYQKTAISDMIEDIAKRAGIERHVKCHMLRRTCARMYRRSGAPITEIQIALRHKSPQTTRDYLGLLVDDLSVAALRFDDYFNQQKANFRRNGFSQEISEPVKGVDWARFELAASTMPR